MYSLNPSNDICQQTFTQFTTGLPLLPPLSPLILTPLHTPDFPQWYQQDLEYFSMKPIPSSNLQVSPSPDTVTREHGDGALNHSNTDTKDKNIVTDPWRQELTTETLTRKNSSGECLSTASQDDSGSSIYSESNNAAMVLPPLRDVGAFHANACIVEMLAPTMQRGSSHRAEVLSTTKVDSKNSIDTPSPFPNPVIDLEFLSFSPSWKLELTLSSPWHLVTESDISLSQPAAQGSSLVRRPATRRKGVSHPNSPKTPLRKSPYMNGSRTLLGLSQKRSPPESGILRAINSPMLKSRGYRVRFQEVETQ